MPQHGGARGPQRVERTDDQGDPLLSGLPPATYTVTVSKHGYETVTRTVTPDPDTRDQLDVHLGLSDPSSMNFNVLERLKFPGAEDIRAPLAEATVTVEHVREDDV